MSQLNVNTIGARTGNDISIAAGKTLKDSSGNAFITSQGVAVADHFDIISTVTGTGLITNWARPTGTLQGNLGSGMTVSSGIFTFPSTGYYYVICNLSMNNISGNDSYMTIPFYSTNDNFSSQDSLFNISLSTDPNTALRGTASVILDITDVSNQKVKLEVQTEVGTVTISGSTSESRSNLQFFKLGDT